MYNDLETSLNNYVERSDAIEIVNTRNIINFVECDGSFLKIIRNTAHTQKIALKCMIFYYLIKYFKWLSYNIILITICSCSAGKFSSVARVI